MNKMNGNGTRTRGAKPQNPDERVACVAEAVRALEKIGAAFSVSDVAERAGISRATIYRSPELRALVGTKGDMPRPVHPDVHAGLAARHEATKAKARDLRRRLAEAERGWEEMRERAVQAERRLQAAEQRVESLKAQNAGMSHDGLGSLTTVARQLGPSSVRRARRQLARALHPDLFTQDEAAAALATELLKTLNALAE